jgi:hypothetical protein
VEDGEKGEQEAVGYGYLDLTGDKRGNAGEADSGRFL